MPVVHRLVHGQELYGRDPPVAQISYGGIRCQSGVGAAQVFGHFLVQLRETSDVHLVDQRLAPRSVRRAVISPSERLVDNRSQGRELGIVALVERQIGFWVSDLVSPQLVRPAGLSRDGLRV